jgi:hypothetical protein
MDVNSGHINMSDMARAIWTFRIGESRDSFPPPQLSHPRVVEASLGRSVHSKRSHCMRGSIPSHFGAGKAIFGGVASAACSLWEWLAKGLKSD